MQFFGKCDFFFLTILKEMSCELINLVFLGKKKTILGLKICSFFHFNIQKPFRESKKKMFKAFKVRFFFFIERNSL